MWKRHLCSDKDLQMINIEGWLEFNVPFQHKYDCIRDEINTEILMIKLAEVAADMSRSTSVTSISTVGQPLHTIPGCN